MCCRKKGIATPVFGSFNEAEEAKVARISAASIVEAAESLANSQDTDGVFLSCTNLKALDVLEEVTARTGKPGDVEQLRTGGAYEGACRDRCGLGERISLTTPPTSQAAPR